MGPLFEGHADTLNAVRRHLFEALARRDALQATADLERALRVAAGLVSLAAGVLAWVVAYSPPCDGSVPAVGRGS